MQPYSISVVPPWKPAQLVGGCLSCDFANTFSDRVDLALAQERMVSADTMIAWAVSTRCLTPAEADQLRNHWPDDGLARLITLREAIHDALGAAANEQPIPVHAMTAVLAAVTPDATAHMLSQHRPGGLGIATVDGLASTLSLDTIDVLLTAERSRLRTCPRCGWLFYDRSKAGKRRWCNMNTCGNREKASRHYSARRKASASPG